MSAGQPGYFPGSVPGADPLFDFEAAYARKVAAFVPAYPLAYGWAGGPTYTQPGDAFGSPPRPRAPFASRIRRPRVSA